MLKNPLRGRGLPASPELAEGRVIADPAEARQLLDRCPTGSPTPLRNATELARELGVASLHLKDESQRMGLGSFKALGAAYVIAREAAQRADSDEGPASCGQMANVLSDTVYACASAGNHGLSVAAGARVFGARAVIYLSLTVPEAFAERLRRFGADVVRAGDNYEASMKAAAADAEAHGWTLLSDSSWPGYVALPTRVMEGYLIMGAEVADEIPEPPTHVFLQAGVGGFAAAMTALFRARWGDAPTIVVVEPEAAPALIESVRAGRPVTCAGPASTMGRLDCKEPSHVALAELAREADYFLTISDDECATTETLLARHGIDTTASGAAGVAGLHQAGSNRAKMGITAESRVLAFITEGRENQ